MSEELDLLGFHKYILLSIVTGILGVTVFWFLASDIIRMIPEQESAIERLVLSFSMLGLTLAVAFICMMPIHNAHTRKMERDFAGYDVSGNLTDHISQNLIGTETVTKVREDDGTMLGMSLGTNQINYDQTILEQRENVPCEECDKTLGETGELGMSETTPYIYLEKHKQYNLIVPLYSTRVETKGYCAKHRPEEY
jgi:hypothetical protein